MLSWSKGKQDPQTIAKPGLTRDKLMLRIWIPLQLPNVAATNTIHYQTLRPHSTPFQSEADNRLQCIELFTTQDQRIKTDAVTSAPTRRVLATARQYFHVLPPPLQSTAITFTSLWRIINTLISCFNTFDWLLCTQSFIENDIEKVFIPY
ncbi:hypothetical protein EVAR_79336_1 [Eumeta japonica]|uniref:Uncharacterized protein n=1 Tax=Eumeta variegata TaxID=151549 RepID=A0A4C1TEV3_EUMVA|nr:hypothetical protein EVAR_79336_1 [Eumeta japonica]